MANTTSDIEMAIQNLEVYIENAKFATFSQNKIVVNKEDVLYYIDDLKKTIPEEVDRYRKIISNKEAIEREAQEKADQMLAAVKNKTTELLSENEIMRRAQEEADEIVRIAIEEAKRIVDEATIESTNYKDQARQYLNDMLINLHELIYDCIDNTAKNTNKFLDSLNQVGMTVSSNLDELNGVSADNDASDAENTEDNADNNSEE